MNNLNKKLENVKDIQDEEIKFSKAILDDVEKMINEEKNKIESFDKEKETIKNGIMNKIFYAIFGTYIKRLKFGCYVKFDGKIIWNYELPKN